MNVNIFEKANRIVRDCDVAYIALADERGFPMVSAIGALGRESIFELHFATGKGSHKYKCLQSGNKCGVCFHSSGSNVSLIGSVEILEDVQTKEKFWDESYKQYFPIGTSDPSYIVLKFTTERAVLYIDGDSAEFSVDDLLTVQSRCGLLCKWCEYKTTHSCAGCVELNGNPFWGECPIAKCCQGKGYSHCGECADVPCEALRGFSYDDPEHGDNPPGARVEVCKAWAKRVTSK